MDYDTFTKKFPSDVFLRKWAITEGEYKKKFIATFNAKGFLAVGMSDVELSKLFDVGAVEEKHGKMCIVPEKFDITERYNREVRGSAHSVLDLVVSFVRDMQRGKEPVFPIVISPHGALSFGTKQISTEEVVDAVGMTPEVVTALLTDLRNLLKNDPLLWSAFGTFTVKDNTVECVPNPHMPEVARLTPRVGPKAKRLDI